MSDTEAVVHLVGSVPLSDADAVFRAVAGTVGGHVASIPDGETGDRIGWIKHLEDKLANHPLLEVDPNCEPFELRQWDGELLRRIELLRMRPQEDARDVRFETGYADAAIESFAVFERLQSDGTIAPHVRFQVSIPTPMAAAFHYIAPSSRAAFVEVYQRSLLAEVQQILEQLPRERLAIQWDVCQEILVFEDYYPGRPTDYKSQIFQQLGELGDAIPGDVRLGYHLCYGSPKDEHLVQPRDMGILAEVTLGIVNSVKRRVDYIQMPVPKERTDDDYFAPLSKLQGLGDTALYLGLIHFDDEAGDIARLAAAQKHTRVGGVSAECGWGRTDPDRVPGLLQSHRKLVETFRGP